MMITLMMTDIADCDFKAGYLEGAAAAEGGEDWALAHCEQFQGLD